MRIEAMKRSYGDALRGAVSAPAAARRRGAAARRSAGLRFRIGTAADGRARQMRRSISDAWRSGR